MLVNAYSTLADPPAPTFGATVHAHRRALVGDEWDPELAEHLLGFRGYVWHLAGERMTAQVYAVLEHLHHVRTHVSMEVPEQHLDALAEWGWGANVLVVLEDGSVLDPSGRAVLPEPGSDQPAPGEVPVTEEARERAARVRADLAARGIQVASSLPPVRSSGEVVTQRPVDVALRAVALAMTAEVAAGVALGEPADSAPMVQAFPRADAARTPEERAFVDERDAGQAVQLSWRWEAAAALLWALGRWGADWPDEPVDTGRLAQALFGVAEAQALGAAHLLPTPVLLEEQERMHGLLWAVRQAEQVDGEPVPGVDAGVVVERLTALNWLLDRHVETWDETDTPT